VIAADETGRPQFYDILRRAEARHVALIFPRNGTDLRPGRSASAGGEALHSAGALIGRVRSPRR
jgi:hypothetical protein